MSDLIRKLLTFSLLLFTGFCFLKAGTGLISGDGAVSLTEVEAMLPARAASQRLITTPIQKLQPGMRVLGRNPDRFDTQPLVDPNPVSWRLVSVRMEQHQPGQFVLGELLRPTSWIRHNGALPGAVIQLEISEMHVAGDAEVLSIAECPPIRRGPGSVVTGTFQHVSDEVIGVFVEGESEPIGATSQHPIWSRDRNAFVPAGELRIGEELKTALGTSTRVTSIEIRAGPETVYGLEVAGEHVYQITNAGLLVHNASGRNAPSGVRNFRGEPVRIPEGHIMSPRDPAMSAPPIIERGPFTTAQREAMLGGASGGTRLSPHHRHQIPTTHGGVIDELPGPGHPAGNVHTAGSPSRHPSPSVFNSVEGGNALRSSEIRSHWQAKAQRMVEVEPGVWIDPGL